MKYRGKPKFDLTDNNILIMLSEGFAVKEIADKLRINTWEIRNRITSLRHYTNSKNCAHLVSKFQNQLIIFK